MGKVNIISEYRRNICTNILGIESEPWQKNHHSQVKNVRIRGIHGKY